MTRKLLAVVLTLVALTMLSLGLLRLQQRGAAHSEAGEAHAEGEKGHAEEETAATVVPGLKTLRISLTDAPEMLTLNGEVQYNADRMARVGAPVSGRLVSLRAKVGDRVKAGQVLATVASRDVAEVASELTRARAEEQAAAARLETVRAMAASGALTQKPLEEAKKDRDSCVAAFRQAETALIRAKANKERLVAELERVKKLAAAKAFQAPPEEQAKREVDEATAELETAQATVAVKQAAFSRSQRLLDAGIVAQRELESAEAELQEALARQKEATAHLSVAKQALERERSIAGQDLYTVREVRDAQAAVRDAEKEVDAASAELERTRAHLNVAEAAYTREKGIAARNLNANKELREAAAAHTVARAQVQAALNSLSALRATGGPQTGGTATLGIVAPIDGVVIERQATPGQAVEASTELFTLAALDPVWVWANTYERDLSKIAVGQAVQVRVNSFPDQTFDGTITHIAQQVDPKSRTARIRCVVPNPAEALKPGMFATVGVIMPGESKRILLPREAVLDEAGKKIVFVSCADCPEDKQAGKSVCGEYDKLEVTVGARRGNQIEITGGLEEGAEVVVAGQYQLKTALGSGQLEAGCADGH